MSLFSAEERAFAEAISALSYCNPFGPERVELERQALGPHYAEQGAVWSKRGEDKLDRPNVIRLMERVEPLVKQARQRLADGQPADPHEQQRYDDLVVYFLFHRYESQLAETLHQATAAPRDGDGEQRIEYWAAFLDEYQHYFRVRGHAPVGSGEAAHLFACLFQVRRAFHHIYHFVVGESMPVARLRAEIWESIFTHDMRRYRRTLYQHLGDVATLISGPSGTGKELVARAVGHSRYIPFDSRTCKLQVNFSGSFLPLNLSALSPTLIESELFGHCRGAFTGAVSDRVGWLEQCNPLGTVFLDEIGDLNTALQVKLLRVLQARTFQRLGETAARRFAGKIIAATNRDLAAEMQAGRFREDFYYRLCADMVHTPSLREQLADRPDDLGNLLRFLAQRIAGDECEAVAEETQQWIETHLGEHYPWPGNIRELEQCLRNVMVHQRYLPPPPARHDEPWAALAAATEGGTLTADELMCRYCTWAYEQAGSYEQAAKRLGLDRRTLRSKVLKDP